MTYTENQVRCEVRVAARPETIWPFLVDPGRMTEWMGVAARIDARVGGEFTINVSGQDYATGNFVSLEPYRRVVFSWGWEGEGHPIPPGSSLVEIELIPDGSVTVIRLSHSGLPEVALADHGKGWEHYLARLAIVAGGGSAGPDPWIKA